MCGLVFIFILIIIKLIIQYNIKKFASVLTQKKM